MFFRRFGSRWAGPAGATQRASESFTFPCSTTICTSSSKLRTSAPSRAGCVASRSAWRAMSTSFCRGGGHFGPIGGTGGRSEHRAKFGTRSFTCSRISESTRGGGERRESTPFLPAPASTVGAGGVLRPAWPRHSPSARAGCVATSARTLRIVASRPALRARGSRMPVGGVTVCSGSTRRRAYRRAHEPRAATSSTSSRRPRAPSPWRGSPCRRTASCR